MINCFHSIGIPSEWGLIYHLSRPSCRPLSFHSIGIPSEWGLKFELKDVSLTVRFHSIGIPSEWGQRENENEKCRHVKVSIQLGSPASGDSTPLKPIRDGHFKPRLRGIATFHQFYLQNHPSEVPQTLAPSGIEG